MKFQYVFFFAASGTWHQSPTIPDILHLPIHQSFADVVSAEAHELGIQVRSFDPDVYINFINSDLANQADPLVNNATEQNGPDPSSGLSDHAT